MYRKVLIFISLYKSIVKNDGSGAYGRPRNSDSHGRNRTTLINYEPLAGYDLWNYNRNQHYNTANLLSCEV
jgi:hypothetical protein